MNYAMGLDFLRVIIFKDVIMRLYLKLTRGKKTLPFNYQSYLTGALHKWIGSENELHEGVSLYSFSWLQNVKPDGTGINVTNDSYFFISAYDGALIKRIVSGIIHDPSLCFDIAVTDVEIAEEPTFSHRQSFLVASPVFIKRRFENRIKHVLYSDPESKNYLTETLQKKLLMAGLNPNNVTVEFDRNASSPRVKLIRYKEVDNRASLCPVVIEGTPEQIAFAWNVGVGNSTGIGFGALK